MDQLTHIDNVVKQNFSPSVSFKHDSHTYPWFGVGVFRITLQFIDSGESLVSGYEFNVKPNKISDSGSIYTRPENEGEGLARTLIYAREKICRGLEIPYIVIDLNRNQPKAGSKIDLWEHFGYRIIDSHNLSKFRQMGLDINLEARPPMYKQL